MMTTMEPIILVVIIANGNEIMVILKIYNNSNNSNMNGIRKISWISFMDETQPSCNILKYNPRKGMTSWTHSTELWIE